MRIIISENKLVSMVKSILDYNLSRCIEMITDYWDASVLFRYYFRDREKFYDLLNQWGPMYFIKTPTNGYWSAQQREGGKWYIHLNGNEDGLRIDEQELLSYMGIGVLGIPLGVIIDNFHIEV